MKLTILISILFSFFSCKEEYNVNKDFVYNSNGFVRGFTLESINVNSFSHGVPENYESTNDRYDVKYSGAGDRKTRIWFYKDNDNYLWVYRFDKEYKILPVKFEKEKWYVLWSNEFTDRIKGTIKVFFIHCDSTNSLHIYFKVHGQPW